MRVGAAVVAVVAVVEDGAGEVVGGVELGETGFEGVELQEIALEEVWFGDFDFRARISVALARALLAAMVCAVTSERDC